MEKLINWKVTLLAFIGAFSVILFLFPLAHFEATEILDLKISYTSQQADELIRSYSNSDRATYRWFTVSIDILFPLCYGIFYFSLVSVLGRKLFNHKLFEKIKYIALGGALFDILENISIFIMLSVYPKPSGFIGTVGGIFTSLKWFSTAATWILLIVIILALLINKMFAKKS